MINFLTKIFLVFTILSTPISTKNSIRYDANDIDKTEIELNVTHNLGIGRHHMFQIKNVVNSGTQFIDRLTSFYNGQTFTDFSIKTHVEAYKEALLINTSLEEKTNTAALGVKCKIKGLDFKSEVNYTEVKSKYSMSYYYYGEKNSIDIEFVIKPEYIDNREFALCTVADIFLIEWDTWAWDDYWWGNYEVKGSRLHHTSYVAANECVSLCYDDGTFII